MEHKESVCGCDLCRQIRPKASGASNAPESRAMEMPRYPAQAQPVGRLIPRL